MPPDIPTISVAQLTDLIKLVVEESVPPLWVSGEISNLSQPASGHYYFTLKDASAQIRAVIWKLTASRLKFRLKDGMEVLVFGSVQVYGPRGYYQIVIQDVQPKGMGALELAFRQRFEKLAREGLFDRERKRPLPAFPRRIAFVTSPTGAAVRDFLEVLRRRFPGTDVLIVPARVQGDGAAEEIAAAIRLANACAEPLGIDVLVVGRGGGSLEDLWAFNEEVVARAIYASQLPVVSAVGHEVDVTIADHVADRRALTPSEAAELVVPSMQDLRTMLHQRGERLAAALRSRVQRMRMRLENLAQRRVLAHPWQRLDDERRRLDELAARAERAVRQRLQAAGQSLEQLSARLAALSPLHVLGRGYSLTYRAADGKLVRDAEQLIVGELIRTRVERGEVVSRVEETRATEGT